MMEFMKGGAWPWIAARGACVGLDFCDSAVRLVELRRKGLRGSRLGCWASVGLPKGCLSAGAIADMDAVVQAVRGVVVRLGIMGRRAAVALPPGQATLHWAQVPSADPPGRQALRVKARLDQLLGAAAQDCVFDFALSETGEGAGSHCDALVVAARRGVVMDYLAIAEAAGLRPGRVVPATQAALWAMQVWRQRRGRGRAGSAWAAVDARSGTLSLALARDGSGQAVAEFATQAPLSTAELAQSIVTLLDRARAAAEVPHLDQLLLGGGLPSPQALAVELSRRLGFQAVAVAPFDGLQEEPGDDWPGPGDPYHAAFGTALGSLTA